MIRILKVLGSILAAVVAAAFGLVPPIAMIMSAVPYIREQLSYKEGPYRAGVWEAIGCLMLCLIWLAVLAFIAIKGVYFLIRARHEQHRRQRGLCAACGYDLRGGHERCPECGVWVLGRKVNAGKETTVTTSLMRGGVAGPERPYRELR